IGLVSHVVCTFVRSVYAEPLLPLPVSHGLPRKAIIVFALVPYPRVAIARRLSADSPKLGSSSTSRSTVNGSVSTTATVWICMCGLSKNQPFCDGSHKEVVDEED